MQPPLRNAHPPERPRRPPSISDGNNRPHVHNDHQHHNQHHHPNVPETIHPHEVGAGHDHENPNNLPPPPPPVPVIVDQLHRDIPIPGEIIIYLVIFLVEMKYYYLKQEINKQV